MRFIGVSYDGAMGGLLAGIEPRIKAFALVVGNGGLVSHNTRHAKPIGRLANLSKSRQQRWLKAMQEIESLNYIGRTSAQQLFQSALWDQFIPR